MLSLGTCCDLRTQSFSQLGFRFWPAVLRLSQLSQETIAKGGTAQSNAKNLIPREGEFEFRMSFVEVQDPRGQSRRKRDRSDHDEESCRPVNLFVLVPKQERLAFLHGQEKNEDEVIDDITYQDDDELAAIPLRGCELEPRSQEQSYYENKNRNDDSQSFADCSRQTSHLLSLTLKYSPRTALTASGTVSSFLAFFSFSKASSMSSETDSMIRSIIAIGINRHLNILYRVYLLMKAVRK